MAEDIKTEQKEKHYPKFANFGEYLFWSYANLQMLCAALNMGKAKYDRSCYMIRAKAFKAYKEGRWNIHDLLEFNVAKIKENKYLKNIYLYSVENGLMDKHRDEMEQMDLPFNYRYIPLDYPQPELFM